MHTVTCCHTLTGALQAGTHKGTHTKACTATHTSISCFPGGYGASGTEGRETERERVWFICLDLIIETGLFLQPLLQPFLYSWRREREGEKGRENKALTAFSHNGEWLSHPLSTVTVCRLSAQTQQETEGWRGILCYNSFHPHLTWMCTFTTSVTATKVMYFLNNSQLYRGLTSPPNKITNFFTVCPSRCCIDPAESTTHQNKRMK